MPWVATSKPCAFLGLALGDGLGSARVETSHLGSFSACFIASVDGCCWRERSRGTCSILLAYLQHTFHINNCSAFGSLNYFFKISIYLFGFPGSQLWHLSSSIFITTCGIFSCGMQTLSFSVWDPEPSNLSPLHQKCRVLATGPPGKSLDSCKFQTETPIRHPTHGSTWGPPGPSRLSLPASWPWLADSC